MTVKEWPMVTRGKGGEGEGGKAGEWTRGRSDHLHARNIGYLFWETRDKGNHGFLLLFFFVFALLSRGKKVKVASKEGDHEEGFPFMVGCCTFVSKGTCCYAYDTLFTPKHI
ncbi:hypothetical protein HDV62DRAFT_220027 [Trichoderma sp. SZMC 28011]